MQGLQVLQHRLPEEGLQTAQAGVHGGEGQAEEVKCVWDRAGERNQAHLGRPFSVLSVRHVQQ